MAPERPEREAVAPWRSRAFGVELELCFRVHSLVELTPSKRPADCVLRLAADTEIDADWPAEEAQLRGLTVEDDGVTTFQIHEHATAGYLLASSILGRYRVLCDGTRVMCSPPKGPDWHWQRLLIGQVLPLLAVLHGLEVLHASAVAIDGMAIAFEGRPGAGKSTLAIHLAMDGATLLADDVVALRVSRGRLMAEPGAALVNIRHEQVALLGGGEIDALGTVLGASDKLHLKVSRLASVLPLEALYLLEPGAAAETTIVLVERPDPRVLLGSTFVPYVTSAARMMAQLEIAALLAQTVPVFRIGIGRSEGPANLADRVRRHALALRSKDNAS